MFYVRAPVTLSAICDTHVFKWLYLGNDSLSDHVLIITVSAWEAGRQGLHFYLRFVTDEGCEATPLEHNAMLAKTGKKN